MQFSPAEMVGSAGVLLLLAAFFLNLTGQLKSGGMIYLAMNAVGAALACLSSWLIDFLPFVLLEGTWAAVAIVSLLMLARGGSGSDNT